jgi:uncharacterized cysteine cluster protein YcgN (CxxCxxCC family)
MENSLEKPYWKIKKLENLTLQEWESLCDGCAQCCLYRLIDDETGEVHETDVACRFLNLKKCRCKVYDQRSNLMATCVTLTPGNIASLAWLPETCAYRLLSEGKDLPYWHPLISGDRDMVHRLGISIRGKAISEKFVDMDRLEDHANI